MAKCCAKVLKIRMLKVCIKNVRHERKCMNCPMNIEEAAKVCRKKILK
jgi:hypothetical protein